MKKNYLLLIILCLFTFNNVYAEDVNVQELIPIDTTVSVTTGSFYFHNLYYDSSSDQASYLSNNNIVFQGIKNLDSTDRYISVTIGLFDQDRKNIGVYYYCSKEDSTSYNANVLINPNEEVSSIIEINNSQLFNNNKVSDIKYISILSDNPNCYLKMSDKYLGKKIQFMNFKDEEIVDNTLRNIIIFIVIVIVIFYLLKFIYGLFHHKQVSLSNKDFGNRSQDKIRKEFMINDYNRKLEEEKKRRIRSRRRKKRKAIKKKEVDKDNTIKDISQEEGNTDLHKLYK